MQPLCVSQRSDYECCQFISVPSHLFSKVESFAAESREVREDREGSFLILLQSPSHLCIQVLNCIEQYKSVKLKAPGFSPMLGEQVSTLNTLNCAAAAKVVNAIKFKT